MESLGQCECKVTEAMVILFAHWWGRVVGWLHSWSGTSWSGWCVSGSAWATSSTKDCLQTKYSSFNTSMPLGNRPQPILIHFFHDGGQVSMLIVCGCTARATHKSRPRGAIWSKTWQRCILCIQAHLWVCQGVWRVMHWMRGHDPMSASASVSEGGKRSDSAKWVMPLMVHYCGGMHSW